MAYPNFLFSSSENNLQRRKIPFLFILLGGLSYVSLLGTKTVYSPTNSNLLLSSEVPTNLSFCSPDTLFFSLGNIGNTAIAKVEVRFDFPPEIRYQEGSISGNGITEADLNSLSKPSFIIDEIPSLEDPQFHLILELDCADYTTVLEQGLFEFTFIAIEEDGDVTNGITDPVIVRVPFLSINQSSISPPYYQGIVGETITRTIPVQNSSTGPIDSFMFSSSFSFGIQVDSVYPGTIIELSDSNYTLLLTGEDFSQFGDQDLLLEQNEFIEIHERVSIRQCINTESTYRSSWGCRTSTCQIDSAFAFIDVDFEVAEPNIEYITDFKLDRCYDGITPVTQRILFTNTGTGNAHNFSFSVLDVNSPFGSISGIDPASFQLRHNDSLVNFSVLDDIKISGQELNSCFNNDSLRSLIEIGELFIGIGDTLEVEWDMYYCLLSCREDYVSGLQVNYEFDKVCPFGARSGFQVNPSLNFNVEANVTPRSVYLEEGDTVHLKYELNSPLLRQEEGKLDITIVLNGGTTLFDGVENFLIDDIEPLSIEYFEQNGTEVGDTTPSIINLTYELPILPRNPSFVFSLQAGCTGEAANYSALVSINSELFFGDDCSDQAVQSGLKICQATSYLNTECFLEPEGIPGVCIRNYRIGRAPGSLGLPDNNADRRPDTSGVLDLSLIRKNHAMAGDTMEEIIDIRYQPGLSLYDHNQGRLIIQFDNPRDDNSVLLSDAGLEYLDSRIVVFDQSDSLSYECEYSMVNKLYGGLGNGDVLYFEYDISIELLRQNGCNLPDTFFFSDLDEISFRNRYVVKGARFKMGTPDEIIATPSCYFHNGLNDTIFNFCPPYNRDLHISAFKLYSYSSEIDHFSMCGTQDYRIELYSLIGDELNDFFPYEFRSFGSWETIQLNIPQSIQFDTDQAELGLYHTVKNPTNTSGFPYHNLTLSDQFFYTAEIPSVLTVDQHVLHIDSVLQENETLPDENFCMIISIPISSQCIDTEQDTLEVLSQFNFNKPYYQEHLQYTEQIIQEINDSSYTLLDKKVGNLRQPILAVDVIEDPVFGFQDTINWLFDVKSLDEAALNTWVYPDVISGDITSFQIIDSISGAIIYPDPETNLFQLGTISAFTNNNDRRLYKLKAVNRSCQPGAIKLKYGWGCNLTDNLVPNNSCFLDSLDLKVIPKTPQLVLNVESPTGPFHLCDSTGYYTAILGNADVGSAYEVFLKVQLPAGMKFLPGSAQMAYPVSNEFIPIPDPQMVEGSFSWNLQGLHESILSYGLPGSDFAPRNSLKIRFKLKSNCEFLSHSFVYFATSYENVCTQSINTFQQPSTEVEIVGVIPPFSTNLEITNEEILTCEDTSRITVRSILPVDVSPIDSLQLVLPPGISYVSNSLTNISNMIEEEPVISEIGGRSHLQWLIPQNIGLASLEFAIDLSGFRNIGCLNDRFFAQTIRKTTASCQNQICEINVQTGSSSSNVSIQKPFLNIYNFSAQLADSTLESPVFDFSLNITNSGIDFPGNIEVNFYLDRDGSGQISEADRWITMKSVPGGILADSTLLIQGTFSIPSPIDACAVIAEVSNQTNCICESSSDIVYLFDQVSVLVQEETCNGIPLMLGDSLIQSNSIIWEPNVNLSCDTCGYALFNVNSMLQDSIEEYRYLQTITLSSGCTLEREFKINVHPAPLITDVRIDSVSCSGFSDGAISVVATGGTPSYDYSWQNIDDGLVGENISNLQSGMYYLTIEDQQGCITSDSIFVPAPPELELDTQLVHIDCFGTETGAIIALPSGGTLPYQLSWNNEEPSTVTSLVNLPAGSYSLSVSDHNDCQVVIENITLNQPPPMSVSTSSTDVTCFESDDGSISLFPTGGIPSYDFKWNDSSLDGLDTLFNLAAGDYFVTVSDANDCLVLDTFSISQPTGITYERSFSSISCQGADDGRISILIEGDNPPFLIDWNINEYDGQFSLDNLSEGNYSATIIDGNGCLQEIPSIPIEEPEKLSLTIDPLEPSCFQFSDGTLDLELSGGTEAYHLVWGTDTVTIPRQHQAQNLAAGSYAFTVVDANNCSIDTLISLGQPNRLTSSLVVEDTITCQQQDALIVSTVEGGIGPYDYSWSDVDGDVIGERDTVKVDEGGQYTFSVLDNRGCMVNDTVFVEEDSQLPEAIITSLDGNLVLDCQHEDVKLYASNSTPAGTLDYQWLFEQNDSISTAANINIDVSGTYTLFVKNNQNQCSDSISLFIDRTIYPPANAGISGLSCQEDFQLNAIQSGSVSGFWRSVDDLFINYPDSARAQVFDLIPGNNYFIWTISTQDCPEYDSDTVVVNYFPTPIAVNDTIRTDTVYATSFNFNVLANDLNIESYSPTLNIIKEPDFGTLTNYGQGNMEFLPDLGRDGLQTIEYELCNDVCCDTAIVQIYFEDNCIELAKKYIPTAFSPINEDGNNDFFDPLLVLENSGCQVNREEAKLVITNKWGEIVYSSASYPADGWNGRTGDNSNNKLPQATYYYYLDPGGGQNKPVIGPIALLR